MAPRIYRCLLFVMLISIRIYAIEDRNTPQSFGPKPTQDDEFDWQLIKYILRQDSRNVALSTFSVKFLLNMLYEGTSVNSATQQELNEPLGRSPDNNEEPKCIKIMQNLTKNTNQFLINSRVFADSMVPVSQRYATILQRQYHAGIGSVDFQHPETATETINGWVNNSTRGMIPQFIAPKDIEDTVMILMNAIYFKGTWINRFSPEHTFIRRFYTASGQNVQVPFMNQIQSHYYMDSSELKAQLIRLPYTDGRFSMIIVLPDRSSNLSELLDAITPQSINAAISSMVKKDVILELPRFQIEYDGSLNAGLQQMGIRRIFQDNAELGEIFQGGPVPVKVSDVRQKTILAVDEVGSTAASVSSGRIFLVCGSCGPKSFYANRPFMFFIEEEATGTIVFAGKMENPAH